MGMDNSDAKLLFVDGLNILCEHFYNIDAIIQLTQTEEEAI
jgi:hypothetical protein